MDKKENVKSVEKMKKWKKRMKRMWILRAILLLSALLIIVLGYFVFIPIEINGSSMIPTLNPEDKVIANMYSKIDRFDVIVFRDENEQPVVKRVIGLPGETISYENDQLYVDQKPIDESFLEDSSLQAIRGNWTSDFLLSEVMEESVIPAGSYFVLGDNRRLSYDSRYYGPVSEEAIIGEVMMVFYPFDRISFAH